MRRGDDDDDEAACTELRVCSLCLDVLALEEGLGVGVSKSVLVPERAGGLQKLGLSGALVITKEPWGKKTNLNMSS